MVQLQIVLTLDDVIRNNVRCYLSDQTTLDIVRACHSLLLHAAMTGKFQNSLYLLPLSIPVVL